jgi:hypothetical protein
MSGTKWNEQTTKRASGAVAPEPLKKNGVNKHKKQKK